ncbi:hypothetical protein [Bacillus sp. S0628]|uniref:hypothetical protein n=1 Tax=Bacillus sp. S0628 TaxID=2957802 RepID=UPI00209FA2F9|nr:hypothetical protein [Bacillus sp. S0628]MCP1324334.1 hypothetical protein [Bacillus sp. S0628]
MCVFVLDDGAVKLFSREGHPFADLYGEKEKLRFYFAISINENHEILIKYDGEFHDKKMYDGHDVDKQKMFDNLKNNYCTKKIYVY